MQGIFQMCTYRKQFFVAILLSLSILSNAQNPIVVENANLGNPSTEWDVVGAGDLSIQGFATDISVNKGGTVRFKIDTDASDYTIDIYRLGYYNGLGARKWGTGTITATLPQNQPDPEEDEETGLVDCGNWAESAIWNVPTNAVSGIYIARLKRTDTQGASHIVFIVRDDASTADLFFQTSDATWQAYNTYGGNSLYTGATNFPQGHAAKVSYNRPFVTRGNAAEDWLFNCEYPMIRFLEKNGYNISYTTNVDVARFGSQLLNHKVFLSVGHDEYWSAEQRNNVEAARNAGIHLAFFSGNEVYWKTRWENSIDGSNTAYRTLVCYKEGTLGEVVCGEKCDQTSNIWTGLWRTGGEYDAGKPENALTGQISWELGTSSIKVPGSYANLRFWRSTTIANLGGEDEATLPFGTLGYEWNPEQYPEYYPSGRITMSRTTIGGKTHKLSLYKHASGAYVFGAGTVQWMWGLDNVHDRGNLPVDIRMQQATVNLFADMGVQPATLQGNLIPATQTTDVTPPTTTIAFPANNGNVTDGVPVTISGTASDVGGVVAGVEISTDGGLTWKVANGTSSWTYVWYPGAPGTAVIKVRGFDDSGNVQAEPSAPAPNAITVTIAAPVCPCTLFDPTSTPQNTNVFDNQGGIELGLKFKSNITGYITGMRFYKSTSDVGTHTVSLWDLNGSLITQTIALNETASGWQQVDFPSPAPVVANQVYVISYHSPTGYYAETPLYFNQGPRINGPLTALANADVDGPNGVYKYSSSAVFPDETYAATHYFLDVVFNTEITPDVTPPIIISTTPSNFSTQVAANAPVRVRFNEFLNAATVTAANFELRDAGNAVVPATITIQPTQITLTPVAPYNYAATYTVNVKGGPSGIADVAGNPLAADTSWSFTVADPPGLPPGEGAGGPILVISTASNPFSRYTAEILRAEGLNGFEAKDISEVDASVLNNYDVVILGEMVTDGTQAAMFDTWVNAGGTLVAFRPSVALAPLMGITKVPGSLTDQYLLINNASGPGAGIVGETIQFHGTADLYTLNGATVLATLYSSVNTATTNPAITTRSVGANGGRAIAFTYDLPKSIVYTRQGNPAWAGQKRDGTSGPIRSDDMFFGGGEPNWINLDKVAIPQADEQQRLLTNIIIQGNLHRKPMPRFWFLPDGHKAAVVMSGDDHANNGTEGRFNIHTTQGPNTMQDVLDWKAVRATSYLFLNTPITNATASSLQGQGFEIGLHMLTGGGCQNYTPSNYAADLQTQLAEFALLFPGVSAPVTMRHHCIAWSDWASAAKIQAQNGIRLDVNYYYWPAQFVQNRSGMFTGSGMPMRFADLDGSLIDCYQVATQMTDESGINYTQFTNELLDRAVGPQGYYGVFCANMHTDSAQHIGATSIINSAQARGVPVISAKQMLTWLDGRNNSSFGPMTWNNNVLSFTMDIRHAARGIQAMVPLYAATGVLSTVTIDGNPVPFTIKMIKGIEYGFFNASSGAVEATYAAASTGSISGSVTLQGRPAAPNARWEVPLTVNLYAAGNTATPAYTFNVTTDQNGKFTINDIPSGSFTITVKNSHTLRRVVSNHLITPGVNNLNFGILREGDVNNSNFITGQDLSILLLSYLKVAGHPNFTINADLNGDGFITGQDLALLLLNYNSAGENP